MKAAAITMVYNENRNLPLWLEYYGGSLGFENLFILDHGSTDGSVFPGLCNHIKLPRTAFDDNVRARSVSGLHRALLEYFDVVIYTDCDEFIVPRPNKFTSLMNFLVGRSEAVTRCIGINVIQHAMNLPPLDRSRSVLRQRPYACASHWQAKPLISCVPIDWHAGFHNCAQPSILNYDLWMFHLKYADLGSALQKLSVTRSIAWSDAALAAGQGLSQRLTDEEILSRIKATQDDITDESLDDLPFARMFEENSSSNLRRIPEEFLDAI